MPQIMEPDHEKRVEDLYQRAVELPAVERDRFLSETCRDDAELRREVEAFLQHGEAAPSRFLAGAADETGAAGGALPLLDAMVGRSVGRYKLLRVIASGGMGTVYEAQQEQPNRKVAIKLIRQGLGSRDSLRRFQYESEVLGQLNHPGIAQIFESGVHREPAGAIPYLAMEYLPEAVSITEHAAARSLGTKERIHLLLNVCDAVQYAHQRAVIHRDLKPANVLVTPDGRPKIIDFGVARILQSDLTVTAHTQTGQVLGTLRYMSPEQCGGVPADVDARTDVYALGVILFELLIGQLPYQLGSSSPFDAPRVIRESAPMRPSAIRPGLSCDLEIIILKALEKERDYRYQSAADLATDLRRYLENKPIEARRHSRWYVARKTLGRHAVAFTALAGFLLTVTAAAVALAGLYRRAEEQRRIAESSLERALLSEQNAKQSASRAQAVTKFLNDMLSAIEPETARGRDVSVLRELFDNASARVRGDAREQPLVAASVAETIGTAYTRLGLFHEAEPLLRDALAWREGSLPSDHPDVADSVNSLALLLKLRGDLAAAEPLYRRALEINLKAYGEEHEVSITAINNLAALLKAKGQHAEAEPLYRKALALSRKRYGSEHADVARGLHNLAMLMRARRDYAASIPLFEEAVAIQRKLYGDGHPRLAIGLEYLGLSQADSGHPEDGVVHAREAVAIGRRVFDPGHPEMGRLLASLADVEKDLGQVEGAEPHYREAIEILTQRLGEDDGDVTMAKNNLALLLKARGEVAEAEQLCRDVLASRRRALGDTHKLLYSPMFNLARLLQDQDRLLEAESLAQELVTMLDRLETRSTSRMRDALGLLGSIRVDARNWERAEDSLRRSLTIASQGAGGEGTVQARALLGRCLAHLGRGVEAESFLVSAYDEFVARDQSRSEDAIAVAAAMVRLCHEAGRTTEAARWKERALLAPTDSGFNDHSNSGGP